MSGWTKNGRLSVYEKYMYLYKKEKIIKYKKKGKLSWKMALPPDESLTSKDGTILICAYCIAGTCVHEHMSPLLGEHLCIVNIFLGPVTVHYREVSLCVCIWQTHHARQTHTHTRPRRRPGCRCSMGLCEPTTTNLTPPFRLFRWR